MDNLIVFHKRDDIKSKISTIIGQKSSLLETSIVKLFAADSGDIWQYSNICGILCLILDRSRDCTLNFQLFHPISFDLLFECEIYYNFINSFKKFNPNFYYFEIYEGLIGFSFSDQKDAESIFKKIESLGKKEKSEVLQEQLNVLKGIDKKLDSEILKKKKKFHILLKKKKKI